MEKITTSHPLSQSEDIVKQNIDTLKLLFPTIVKEGKIDIGELKALLGEDVEENEEYYRFTWAGKSQARQEANKPTTGTLRPVKVESKNWNTTKNIIIEGDNLEALKLLQKSYAGAIKLIYIDPPYNTGKDFVYKDNYKDNLHNYLSLTGQADSEGNKYGTNTESDGRYHSNWLNMMYPRLKLAKNLLKNDGVIFISIDENENYNLIKLCNEIFGESNFLNGITIKAKPSAGASGGGEDKKLKKNVEYLICYTKNRDFFEKFNDVFETKDLFEFIDEYKKSGKSWKYTRVIESFGTKQFFIDTVDGSGENIKIFKHTNVVIKTISELAKEQRTTEEDIYIKYFDKVFRDTNAQSSIRQRVIDATDNNDTFYSIEYIPRTGRNKESLTTLYYRGKNKDLIAWLSDVAVKEGNGLVKKDKVGTLWSGYNWNNISKEGDIQYPNGKKPIEMIKRMIELTSSPEKNDIILDFFAGSGSTAHAVFDFNNGDGGSRKSISIQLPEIISTDDKNEFYSDQQFEHIVTVSDITKERIRRAGDKIKNLDKSSLFNENKFNLDVGFRVFKLDTSNIVAWDGFVEGFEQNIFSSASNIKEGRTEDDILFEILLKNGLDLTLDIVEKEITGKKVYSLGLGALFVCLADNISIAVAEGIGEWKKELEPATCKVIFKDSGFTDVEKTNSIQILKRYGITEVNSI